MENIFERYTHGFEHDLIFASFAKLLFETKACICSRTKRKFIF